MCFGYFTLGERNDWWIDKGDMEMCEFCKNIYTKDYTSTKYKDYIYKDEHGVYIHFATGDNFMDFDYEINNCPKCGRKLVD